MIHAVALGRRRKNGVIPVESVPDTLSNGTLPNYRTAYCQTTERNVAKLPNGVALQQKFGLVEVKLGGETLVNEGAKTLNALARNIDITKMKAPAFKMVLTAVGDVVYRRKEDGIVVCPISALRP